ncbi:mitochondrial 54S ribosomal protein YmL19 [Schizosaccharomyces japonicus yFS275]|uniref:Large ribosomal subunit protein uL11m n=1 Tax=Schizosaccharomyces japonicus (strain yFS275 / FY16936) TaxID=402676 RepID=B6K3V5_SCHJY|nr:mitochondrial 54S ribosomal protein YmL19 [Schizosaccharomyces japonicus yFS275]EEB08162.1 ribosomal protein subunit L19 [Schizosaccharomyces japonicus yFS275]
MSSSGLKNALVKLVVPAGKATPTPPIGPALGARGVKSIDFCKEFNASTASFVPGVPIPCKITITPKRTFTFTIHPPPTSWLLLKLVGKDKGAHAPKNEIIGSISLKHVYEVANIKSKDPSLQGIPLQSICKSVIGSARSMGIKVTY